MRRGVSFDLRHGRELVSCCCSCGCSDEVIKFDEIVHNGGIATTYRNTWAHNLQTYAMSFNMQRGKSSVEERRRRDRYRLDLMVEIVTTLTR